MAVATSDERAQESRIGAARPLSPRRLSPHVVLLPLALLATLALQLPTLSYYFYFDDYLPFSEIVKNGRWEYTWRLLTSTDVTPNWRPLPGMLYLGSYEIAGMNPLPMHLVMLALHAGTAAMLYYVVWRTTARAWAACVAALVFGLNPAYVGALSQVTTATQVMADFFLVATLIAVIECAMAERAARANAWLAGGVGLWVLAIASHEGMAIMFPVFALALFTFDGEGSGKREPGSENFAVRAANVRGRMMRAGVRTAPFAVIAFATAGAFWACGCNEGSSVWGTEYAGRQTLIYLGRMLYPVGLELPTDVSTPHVVAAIALVGLMLVTLAGPKIARVGSLWVLLAIAPHVFIVYFTASRYLYLPAPGFAMLVASVAIMIRSAVASAHARAFAASGAVIVVALCGWYAYQTIEQNRHFADATDDWRRFHRDVTRVFPAVPPGERVLIIGGPFLNYEYQLFVLPAFAETTWGPEVTLQDYAPGSLPAQLALVSRSPYVAEYQDGVLVRLFDDDRNR